jgi:molybdopterin biosynthesis enzyme MoaB
VVEANGGCKLKREVPVEQAIGMALAHDHTRIVPGEFKGRAFTKGHVIRAEDIPLLLDMGKRNVYVIEIEPGELHENDAAIAMSRAVAGQHLTFSDVHEGKVVLKADCDGMLKVDARRVHQMNEIDQISISTRQSYTHVTRGTAVAGVRPVPLTIAKEKVERVVAIAESEQDPTIDVIPYRIKTAALVTTGSEIADGRIKDKSAPVLREKLKMYGVEIVSQVFPGDDKEEITAAIGMAREQGSELICVTGGMSVDPDDRSPAAIRAAADHVVTYGTPILPGSMLMLAYMGKSAIFGLPGAVIYDSRTSFDILLPRILAGCEVTRQDIARLGVGGWLNA